MISKDVELARPGSAGFASLETLSEIAFVKMGRACHIPVLLIPVLAFACAGVQRTEPLDLQYGRASMVDSARRASSTQLQRAHVAEIVGLPSLVHSALRTGYREVRLQLGCDLCLPEYLVRIVEEPRGTRSAVRGDVFVVFSLTAERRDPDEQREAEIRLRAWADTLTRRLSCGDWRDGTFAKEVYHWCLARERSEWEWRSLLDRLNSLGVLGLGAETGYSPTPPTVQRIKL